MKEIHISLTASGDKNVLAAHLRRVARVLDSWHEGAEITDRIWHEQTQALTEYQIWESEREPSK